jgi:hypothetical protein
MPAVSHRLLRSQCTPTEGSPAYRGETNRLPWSTDIFSIILQDHVRATFVCGQNNQEYSDLEVNTMQWKYSRSFKSRSSTAAGRVLAQLKQEATF